MPLELTQCVAKLLCRSINRVLALETNKPTLRPRPAPLGHTARLVSTKPWRCLRGRAIFESPRLRDLSTRMGAGRGPTKRQNCRCQELDSGCMLVEKADANLWPPLIYRTRVVKGEHGPVVLEADFSCVCAVHGRSSR